MGGLSRKVCGPGIPSRNRSLLLRLRVCNKNIKARERKSPAGAVRRGRGRKERSRDDIAAAASRSPRTTAGRRAASGEERDAIEGQPATPGEGCSRMHREIAAKLPTGWPLGLPHRVPLPVG